MDQQPTDIIERDERREALNTFANSGGSSPLQPMAALVRPTSSVVDRIVGAQHVAVYRDEARILQKLSALGAAAGSEWYYRFPVKKKGGGQDYIEGPSIKLANDVARIYGNCHVEIREIDIGDAWVFYARLTDWETGYSTERAYRQRKSQSSMRTDNDRALDIAYQIGQSKAIRNVVTNGLQTFCDFAFDAARNSLIEKVGKNLDAYRKRTIEGIGNLGIEVKRVETTIGRAVAQWTAPDIAKIIAMGKAIQDGMATTDETFPPIGAKPEPEEGEQQPESLDKFAAGQATQATPQATAAATAVTEPAAVSDQAQASGAAAGKAANPKPRGTTAANAAEPKTSAEYIEVTMAWIENLLDPSAGDLRWKSEKTMRNRLNVDPDDRDRLDAALKAKCAALRGSKT